MFGIRNRTRVLVAFAVITALSLSGCGGPSTPTDPSSSAPVSTGSTPALPTSPITLNVIDGGNLVSIIKQPLEMFVAAHPEWVKEITYSTATAPEMLAKIQAQIKANKPQYNIILCGYGDLSPAVTMGLLQSMDDWKTALPDYKAIYKPAAYSMFDQLDYHATILMMSPTGPLLEYDPARTPNPPKTADELLAWAKANPGKFTYARPENSGPGRVFLQGLPYLLKDSDPKDPVNGWDKTWAYLEELNQYIDHYPASTSVAFKELTTGDVDLIASTAGWDTNTRVTGTIPNTYKTLFMDGANWVTDGNGIAMPIGLSEGEQAVIIELMKWLVTPEMQAWNYDNGFHYPGPAVDNVPESLAPQEIQDVMNKFANRDYDVWFTQATIQIPLAAADLTTAYDMWSRLVGNK